MPDLYVELVGCPNVAEDGQKNAIFAILRVELQGRQIGTYMCA